MSTRLYQVTLTNTLRELGRCHDAVRSFLASHTLSFRALYTVDLVLEELVSNTIRYGYSDKTVHDIHVSLTLEDRVVILTIHGDGQEFNPLTASVPETAQSLEETQIGGFGIPLVRSMVHTLDYERIGNRNKITVRILHHTLGDRSSLSPFTYCPTPDRAVRKSLMPGVHACMGKRCKDK